MDDLPARGADSAALLSNGCLIVYGRGDERVHVTVGVFDYVFDTETFERATAWSLAERGQIDASAGVYLSTNSGDRIELLTGAVVCDFRLYSRIDDPQDVDPGEPTEKHFVVLWHDPEQESYRVDTPSSR